jgi:hypothetical protein
MELLSRNGRDCGSASAHSFGAPQRNFHDAADQVVGIRLCDFNARRVPGFRDLSTGQLYIRQV